MLTNWCVLYYLHDYCWLIILKALWWKCCTWDCINMILQDCIDWFKMCFHFSCVNVVELGTCFLDVTKIYSHNNFLTTNTCNFSSPSQRLTSHNIYLFDCKCMQPILINFPTESRKQLKLNVHTNLWVTDKWVLDYSWMWCNSYRFYVTSTCIILH